MPLQRLALGRATTDRAAHLRADPDLLDRLWREPSTRVVRVGDGRTPVGDGPALQLVGPADVPDDGVRVFLGLGEAGEAYVAAAVDAEEDWLGLRRLGSALDDRDAGLLVQAVALLNWHATHTHCPRCGTLTEPVEAGWSRRCPADGSGHYPRTDPAVIMAVTDDDGRLLLGHNPAWPERRFSTLAGFVEPGESIEAAVRREVLEEVGVVIGGVEYLGSQPWPFPASLMLGFTAHAVETRVRTDGVEITDARWFTRDELTAAVAEGEVLLPSGISIARRLVEHWYGGEIADGAEAWR
ncbi:MAG: NAD(+) diphosphatase [Actinomycetes bacterium]